MPRLVIALAVLALGALPARAEVLLPPGFQTHVYVTGDGFEAGSRQGLSGIPASSTLALDHAGILYLARSGRRYTSAELEDLWAIYRIPAGGARLTPRTEARFLYGPPLPNPQIATIRGGRELFVTTFDRDRKVGVLYQMRDGRAELIAGGTPERGTPAVLRQPEGAAVDAAGNLYVADRDQGAVLKLDPSGRVLEPHFLSLTRPRLLAIDEQGYLWIGSDGTAEAPWQQGPGEIWRVSPGRAASLVLRGPMPAGMSVGPGGKLFVADRHAGKIFLVGPEGRPTELAGFTNGDTPRSLTFAPDTPETRRAGIAGDLFVVTVRRGAWPLNEILRISGPFEEFARSRP